MSFLIRSRNSQKWGRSGTTSAATSFSVRTGRRTSGESDSVVLRSGAQEAVRDCLAAAHFLRNETQAARTAVEALDKYILKLASFQDKAMEVIEEAHRALSRLERAVSLSAAPELIVVACEIKVACHRGLHLFRTYGKYRYLGKLVALATHSSITAKFDAVIGRLTAIMPLDRSPSFTNVKTAAAAPAAAGAATQRSSATSHDDSMPDDAGQAQQQLQPAPSQQQQLASINATSSSAAQRLKAGSMRSSADAAVGSTMQHEVGEGAGQVLSVVLRSSEAGKVTCMSFVDTQGASTCIWWAAGDRLEFYSTSTQSTTSFAPHTEKAAITALAVDNVGNIWCANSKGAVMMRQQRNWEQVFVERAFGSCVRCLAADTDSDVVWAGDEAGRLAVFRFVDEGGACKLECTATILPGRAGAGVKASRSSAQLDIKPKAVSRWQALSCRGLKDQHKVAEGPIRTMLVRDDRAWVGGGRTDPWIGLFDAVLGTQLDMWSCGSYGSCLAMTSMLTSDAVAETHTAAAAAALKHAQQPRALADYGLVGLDVPTSVPEDHIGEDPRSSWRLVTGHESGQLLLWNAAADQLQPVIRVGEAGLSPVKSLCVMEEQGLLAVVHANGDLAVFIRPMRDRDWLLGPTTMSAAGDGAGAAAAAAGTVGGGVSCSSSSNSGSAAGSTPGDTLSHALSSGPPAPHGDRARSGGGGGGTNGAGLTTIKPRRVVLHSHRSMLVAAAACSGGVVTASALGSIKLWPAEGLGREAERCGLLPTALQVQRASSLFTRNLASNSRPQQLVSRQHSDSLISNCRSPLEQQHGDRAASAPAHDLAAVAAGAAAAAGGAQLPSQQPSNAGGQQPGPLTLLDYQQQLSERQGSLPAWAQPQIHPQDSMSHPHHQLYALPAHPQPHQQQQQLPDPVGTPNLARLSDPGVQWLQQQQQAQQQQQQQQPGLFMAAPRSTHSGVLPEQLANPLILQQQAPLERRSAPLDVPWQTGMVSPRSAAAAAAASSRGAGMGTAMFARLTAQHQLGQLGGSPRFSGPLGAESLVGSVGATSAGGSLLGPDSLTGGFTAVPPGSQPVHDVPLDSGARYAAPRAPKALREREAGLNRERRRSERRLSKGAMVAWATCQIINASELRMLECIGGGAYGQVFLAEWMGTQVAAKQLLSFQNKAKDEVVKRKAKERAAQHDSDSDDASDSDSDTNSVDSVEEEVVAELKQLMDEVWVLGSLSHPSITRFCALCLDPPMIVMQYYPHGSLFDLLKRGRRGEKRALHELTWAKRLDMLRDIASGMVFLHSRKPPIVHGDLRSPNLLLDLTIDRDRPRFHVKIADFGLARMVGPTSSIAVSKVTNPRWSAPEVLRNSVVSLSADVFSFAVVMWELLTWAQPYEEMMSVQVLFSVMQNYRLEVPPEEELPGKPGPTLPRYVSLMERCWAEDEHARPTFEEVLLELDDLRTYELGQARLRGGDSQRSLQGSTRVSYSEAPGTPTGSCLGGTPLLTSAPGSNISSAPNSGRDTEPIALAAAAAAGAAAASAAAAAAAAAVVRRQSVDDSAVPYGNPQQQQQQQQMGPAGPGQGWRGFAGSAPGTPTGTGVVGAAAGAAAAAAGFTQGPVGSAPTSGNSYSSGNSSKSSTSAPHQAEPGGSAGLLPLPNSELSFAMRPAPGLGGPGAAEGMSGAGGATSPNVPARTPSRLGPTRCSSTISSPTAASGMAPRHEFEPALLEHGASGDGAALGGRGGGLAYQRRNSGGVGGSGALPGSPQQQQQQQPLQLAHTGSRLRRLSWGTLEGSLQSSSSKQLGLQASRASWEGSLVHEFSPAASPVPGERPYSPFAQAAHGLDAAPCSPLSTFSKAQQQQQGGFSPKSARGTQGVPAAAAGVRPSPFAASQLGGDEQGKGDAGTCPAVSTAGGSVAPAAAAAAAPCRPLSPFAAAQAPAAEAGAATCQAAGTVSATQSTTKPYSPFAAAQQLSSAACDAGQSSSATLSLHGSPASRQGTDDSTVAVPQPPARPTSPFAAVQASVPEEDLPQEPSVLAPGTTPAANAAAGVAGSPQRLASPFQAVQGAGPYAAAAAVPSRLSVDAARPASPFAVVQQVSSAGKQYGLDPPHVQGSHTKAAGGWDGRVASMTGSAFAAAPQSLLAFASSGGSSQGSCSAGGGSTNATHRPSRLGGATYAAPVSPFAAAAAANGGGAAGTWQPNDPQVLGELQQLLQQQQQQAQAVEQQGRASPFASVQAAAVQGPIVAQQAKAVLSRLNSQAASTGLPEPHPTAQQELQSPAVSRGLDAAGPNADMPVSNSGHSSGGSSRLGAAAAAAAAAADSDEPLPPLPSFAVAAGAAAHQPHGLVHRGSSGASAAAAAGGPGVHGSPICSGEFALSGDSITFPSGLGAVESVVFMRGVHKPHGPPHPQQ